MNIKAAPTAGFTTRCGRKVYGQTDYDRDKKIVLVTTLATIIAGFYLVVAGVL